MQKLLKQYGLWLALGLTLVATIWTSQQEDVLEPSMDSNVPFLAAKKSNLLNEKIVTNSESRPQELLPREKASETVSNLFTAYTTTENQSIVDIAEPAFINPFTYAGKLVDEGSMTVFLIEGDKSYAVKVGHIIEELWQVKSIAPPIMVLKNLSTKIEVQIQIGALS